MKARILTLMVGFLAAAAARHFITTSAGSTFALPNETRYIPYNLVAFWLLIAITAILCLVPWGRQMRIR